MIRDMHSYELPAIYAVAVDRIFAPYAAWIESSSS
jgi:periplasmic divalent cation tolerance protein